MMLADIPKNVSLYAFSYFLPIILRQGLGYDVSKAQLMTFPPYAVGVVVSAAGLPPV